MTRCDSCLYCGANGPFNTIEHIIPESLGNDDMLLTGEVCDRCQAYFGKEVERYVLDKTPIAAWRVLLGTSTKKGHRPKADLSQPRTQRGMLPRISPHHDDIAIASGDDESVQITSISEDLVGRIERGERSHFQFVLTPRVLYMMGRFLCKVGLGLICSKDSVGARHAQFDCARTYARSGLWKPLWPILWHQAGSFEELKRGRRDKEGVVIEAQCYSIWLGVVGRHTVFEFGIGRDRFTVALDEPLCMLLLETQQRHPECRVLWYPESVIDRWKP